LSLYCSVDRLCGLVIRVRGYRSSGPGSVPGATRTQFKKEGDWGNSKRHILMLRTEETPLLHEEQGNIPFVTVVLPQFVLSLSSTTPLLLLSRMFTSSMFCCCNMA
jgi:hypothetical protein